MSALTRLARSPLLLVLAVTAIGVAVAASWLVYRGARRHLMRQELNESRLLEITNCGDQLLGTIVRYQVEHGRLPLTLSELDLAGLSECLELTGKYGEWELLPSDRLMPIGLRLTMHDSWRNATAWSNISVALRPNGTGAWNATRDTAYSVFPDDLHHLRMASPRIEGRAAEATPPGGQPR